MSLLQTLPYLLAVLPMAFVLGWLLGRKGYAALLAKCAVLEMEAQNLRKILESKDGEYSNIKTEIQSVFENIANKVLKATTQDLSKSSTEQLDLVLKPLKENIENLQKNIVDTREKSLIGNTQIKDLITNLTSLNTQMTEEARNLTRALKSDTKAQGNWGEIILDSILERSGLLKGEQYELQREYKSDEGDKFRPDAVVHLPDDRDIVIDSKVNLTDYERYISAIDEVEGKAALKSHLAAIKAQVMNLNSKNYSHLIGLKSMDFVFLFIPVEPAYIVAVKEDPTILNFALENQTVIVTPSTLIATLRIVSFLWSLETQNKNAAKIADAGGKL